jgi:hypothetical protein
MPCPDLALLATVLGVAAESMLSLVVSLSDRPD